MMNNHKIDTYLDGHFKVQYCTLCGAEDMMLLVECVHTYNFKEFDKMIDKPKDKHE